VVKICPRISITPCIYAVPKSKNHCGANDLSVIVISIYVIGNVMKNVCYLQYIQWFFDFGTAFNVFLDLSSNTSSNFKNTG
jgi:hypothetical protein